MKDQEAAFSSALRDAYQAFSERLKQPESYFALRRGLMLFGHLPQRACFVMPGDSLFRQGSIGRFVTFILCHAFADSGHHLFFAWVYVDARQTNPISEVPCHACDWMSHCMVQQKPFFEFRRCFAAQCEALLLERRK
jgi:hypothetical protein